MDDNILIRKLEGYAPLSDDEKAVVRDLTSRRRTSVPAKSDIISDGECPEHMHLILEGWAARYKILHDGTRRIMGFLIPGDFCDLHITVLRQMDHGIMALTPCKVAYLDSDMMSELTMDNSRLATAMWWMTLVDEAVLRQWVINAARRAVAAIAHLLCEMHLRMKQVGLADGKSFELPLTQEEIGDATGMTTVHVNRTLTQMKKEGLIELQSHRLRIPDMDALAEAGGFDESYLHRRKGLPRRGERSHEP